MIASIGALGFGLAQVYFLVFVVLPAYRGQGQKAPITPQLFTLNPIGEYQYRMVFDLYPTAPQTPPPVFLWLFLAQKQFN